ncbi:urease accessory protein UreD [Acuticoccus yangtzensis]|uniref:urease accessory protein UreD n=1 Tax=Acuticoccus yangtzensis TaxID=1443441 RepID=UPI000AB1D462|nr:urease accessory protein UreD [Acuticoccus yangtzensis]
MQETDQPAGHHGAPAGAADGAAPIAYQRSTGEAAVTLADSGGRPVTTRLSQSGSAKLRFPRVAAGVEALILNTSGGLASGDRFHTEMAAEAHSLTVATLACERVYRCEGPPAVVGQTIRVAGGATLRHLPQPTILFEGARLTRHTQIHLAPGAALTLCEGLVLGRAAMGETVTRADIRDTIALTIHGRLAFLDTFGLTTETLARSGGPAALGGARATGLVLHVGGEGDADTARAALDGAPVVWGASTMGPVTVVRVLAPGHTSLQDALGRAAEALSGAPLPRAWQL